MKTNYLLQYIIPTDPLDVVGRDDNFLGLGVGGDDNNNFLGVYEVCTGKPCNAE